MGTLFGTLTSMVVLATCASPSVSQAEQASKVQVQTQQMTQLTLATRWRVATFNRFIEKELAGTDAHLGLSEIPKMYGKMGCGGMMFQANMIGSDRIDFDHTTVNMMLCEDMKLEDTFLRKQSVWSHRFGGNGLILEQKGISIRLRRE